VANDPHPFLAAHLFEEAAKAVEEARRALWIANFLTDNPYLAKLNGKAVLQVRENFENLKNCAETLHFKLYPTAEDLAEQDESGSSGVEQTGEESYLSSGHC
jgi:hypothetical protein